MNRPQLTSDARSHRRSNAEALMNPHKVMMHVKQSDHMHVVLDLLREGVSQASEATHIHSHVEVLAFDVRSADVLGVGVTDTYDLFGALPLRRAVTFLAFRIIAVNLYQLGEVDIFRERISHGGQVHLMAVRGQLDSIRQAACNVLKEVRCTPGIPPSYQPTDNELGLRFDGRIRPHVATDTGFHFLYRYLLLLAANEAPNFINLNTLSGNVADGAILIGRTGRANLCKQPEDGSFGYAGHARSGANRAASTSAVITATFFSTLNLFMF